MDVHPANLFHEPNGVLAIPDSVGLSDTSLSAPIDLIARTPSTNCIWGCPRHYACPAKRVYASWSNRVHGGLETTGNYPPGAAQANVALTWTKG
jgi:hypothetical protein